MKILQLIHSLNPGGAERLVVDLSNELSANDANHVTVISLKNRSERNEDFYEHELSNRVRLIKMNYGDGAKFSYLLKLSQKINELKPDVVHVHCQIHYIFLAFILNRKCRFVYTLHNRADILLNGVRKTIAQLFSKSNRLKIVTISDSNRTSLHEFSGITNDVLIYNGRAVPVKTPQYEETKIEIDTLKANADDLILLVIAKCSKQKNLKLLIDSINALTARDYHLKLLVIGDNYQSTDMGRELIALAGPSVHFLGTKNNVADYFNLCDAFCLSSIFEGMPITLLEAFACGCTPISTPVSGSVDIINDGITGFISPDFALDSYVKTIERYIQFKDQVNKGKLKDVFNKNYSIEKCALEYHSLFNKII
ncbi:glycosyltransferase [Pedobacter sp. WC2501]|uniref:glycosyltransferase n=1 Tax=Pedobacter sp. WC2501 TaxID=3461400 RepID=UPI00404559C5